MGRWPCHDQLPFRSCVEVGWAVGEAGAQLLWGQVMEQGLGALATAYNATPPLMPPEVSEAGSQVAAGSSQTQELGLGARWDKRHCLGQHSVKNMAVILSGLHHVLHHGTLLLLDHHLPLQEAEKHPTVLVVFLDHLLGLVAPGPTLLEPGLGEVYQVFEDSHPVLDLALTELVYNECTGRGCQCSWGPISASGRSATSLSSRTRAENWQCFRNNMQRRGAVHHLPSVWGSCTPRCTGTMVSCLDGPFYKRLPAKPSLTTSSAATGGLLATGSLPSSYPSQAGLWLASASSCHTCSSVTTQLPHSQSHPGMLQ